MAPSSLKPSHSPPWGERLKRTLLTARANLIASAKRSRIARKLWENRRSPHMLPIVATREICKRLLGGRGYGAPAVIQAALKRDLLDFLAHANTPLGDRELGELKSRLRSSLALSGSIRGPEGDAPEVSIVISVFNQLRFTIRCIESILASDTKASFEIIIINDASTDRTADFFGDLSPLRFFNQVSSEGLAQARNRGAAESRGKYVLFLNNDTHVLNGWLDELVDTLKANDRVAMVGSRLLYPDGSQCEAGGMLLGDGQARSYGRNDDPNRPEYSYLRSVDYCSGSSLLVRKALFDGLGGFDLRYASAKCEDVDIALRARSQGHEVVYQPRSKVARLEVKSGGRDNRGAPISSHGASGARVELERDRSAVGHILFVDACVPTPDRDAGSVVTDSWIKILRSLGYHVTFVGVHQFVDVPPYTERLERMGVYCPRFPYDRSPSDLIFRTARDFDGIVTCRHECSRLALDSLAKAGLTIPTIFLPIDLHYVREARLAELEGSATKKAGSELTKQLELEIVARSNVTCVHSSFEKEELERQVPSAVVTVSPIMFPVPGRSSAFDSRRDLCFIGGFKHTPNIDAVNYFVSEVWPLVLEKLPGLKFKIIGGDAPPEIVKLSSSSVEVLGFVPDLAPIFKEIRLCVAPLRYGAGVKGKVGISMSNGVPIVGTPMAFEGMNLRLGEEVLSATSPSDFADLIIRAYSDADLWYRVSDAGVRRADAEYSLEGNAPLLSQFLVAAGLTAHSLSRCDARVAT